MWNTKEEGMIQGKTIPIEQVTSLKELIENTQNLS